MSFSTRKVSAEQSGTWTINVGPAGNRTVLSGFNSITSVPANILTTIITYTVPAATSTYLEYVETSGTNIATYEVWLNGTLNARQRTMFGSDLNAAFDYKTATTDTGLKLAAGDVIQIKVEHPRPYMGDFESRLLLIEET